MPAKPLAPALVDQLENHASANVFGIEHGTSWGGSYYQFSALATNIT
jgi:hypothetical protein